MRLIVVWGINFNERSRFDCLVGLNESWCGAFFPLITKQGSWEWTKSGLWVIANVRFWSLMSSLISRNPVPPSFPMTKSWVSLDVSQLHALDLRRKIASWFKQFCLPLFAHLKRRLVFTVSSFLNTNLANCVG